MNQAAPSTVNVHYLDHVMTIAEERQVEATEDIFAENGMKLVAKGYAINQSIRERLLAHKLVKPLEDCMAVSAGVTGARSADMVRRLLARHPMLQAICDTGQSIGPVQVIEGTTFGGRMQTLMTVYAEHQAGKAEHAVCVTLLALGLAQRVLPGDVAVKLIAGEFSRPMIDEISRVYKTCRTPSELMPDAQEELSAALEMSRQLGAKLEAIVQLQVRFQPQFERGSQPFKLIWQQAARRFESIRRAWSSTGLDVQPDGAWLQHESPEMQHEVAIILREIDWRLGELERELMARVSRQAAGDLPLLERYLREWRQTTAQVATCSGEAPGAMA